MAKPFGGLLRRIGRGDSKEESSKAKAPAVDAGEMALDDKPVGPPILMPAAIFSQPLVNATEITPAWLRPRPAPAPVVPAADTKAAKRSSRPKTAGSSGTTRPRTRRVTKPDRDAAGD
jgi:hypothetical protein